MGLSTPVARAALSGSARWRDRATPPAKYRPRCRNSADACSSPTPGWRPPDFHEGFDLPCFAAFDLIRSTGLEQARRAY